MRKHFLVSMDEHLCQELRSETVRSNWLYEKPGCDVHEGWKGLKLTLRLPRAVHSNPLR